jgi:hypothetical protein
MHVTPKSWIIEAATSFKKLVDEGKLIFLDSFLSSYQGLSTAAHLKAVRR